MNAQRRKDIQRAIELLDEANQILSAAADEEQEYYDNMPESIQGGERGEAADAAADRLADAAADVDAARSNAQESLDA